MAAGYAGRKANIDALLRQGATLDAQDRMGQTALTYAALSGDEACVQLLVKRGADPNKKNAQGVSLYKLMQAEDAGMKEDTFVTIEAEMIRAHGRANKDAIMRFLKVHGMRE